MLTMQRSLATMQRCNDAKSNDRSRDLVQANMNRESPRTPPQDPAVGGAVCGGRRAEYTYIRVSTATGPGEPFRHTKRSI